MDHVIEYQAQCRCGWRSDPSRDQKVAEIQADAHEAAHIGRRSHRHDATAVEVAR